MVPYVVALAKACGSTVTLVHVVDTSALQDTGRAWVELPSVKQFVDEETARAETYLATTKQRLADAGVSAEVQVTTGVPAATVVALADSTKADLIAMSTHGRSGVARMVIGSVADRIIHETTKPLLLFRPTEGTAAAAGIKPLIVPLDGSPLAEQTLATVEGLAKALNVPVTLFRAVSTYTFAFAGPYPFGEAAASVEILEAIEQEAQEYLDQQAAALRGKGLTVDVKWSLGDPATQLVELAHDTPDSLTIMSTHGRSGVARALLGSVADRTIRSSGRPVLLVRTK